MKNLASITAIAIGLLIGTGNTAFSQINAGAGLAFGTETETVGIQVHGMYEITEEITGAADVTIYFPDGFDWWELNINGHYGFYSEKSVNAYGLAGINYTTFSFDAGQFGSFSNSEIGLNIGTGAEYRLDFANLFGEVKYVIGDYDQLALTAGLRFSF